MTSKEALIKICEHIIYHDTDGFYETIGLQYADEYEIIKEDLEVLKILKEHKPSFFRLNLCISVEDYNLIYKDGTCPKTFSHKILSKREFELLKEWLRNDN